MTLNAAAPAVDTTTRLPLQLPLPLLSRIPDDHRDEEVGNDEGGETDRDMEMVAIMMKGCMDR